MISIKINPDFYTTDINNAINGWSNLSPFSNLCPDYTKFVLTIGKSGDVVIKTNYSINDPLFGGSRSITVNHVGAELNDSMFHTMVNNPNQYDYIVLVIDHVERGHIKVYHNGAEMTTAQIAHFTI